MPRNILSNKQIADIFDEMALYLEAQDIPFKPQAYQIAAETIRGLNQELSDLYKTCGDVCIDDLAGIGTSLTEKIVEAVTTGNISEYQMLKKQFPFHMLELTHIQDVGPKTALHLYESLNIKTIKDLERAAKAGKISTIPHMGIKTQRNMLRAIAFLHSSSGRQTIHLAMPFAQHLVEKLQAVPGVKHIEIAGSLRRRKETIGDIDLLATTTDPSKLIRAFKQLAFISEILEEGPTKMTVRYTNNMNGDLRILQPEAYGAGLVYFTGSKEHNILLRQRAIKQKMKLSEYGLFQGKKRLASKTEKHMYTALGLSYIPPEIRVGADEIERAVTHHIPTLVEYGSLKGDLQVQTNWSDGTDSIEDMALAAKAYGLSYIAVTDHTQSLHIAHGLDEKRLLNQGKEIDQLNKRLKGFRLLKSTECDIRKDGSLDLSDTALCTLDLVCLSVHTNRKMTKQAMTERIIRGIQHPLVHILLHPTGRIINVRDQYAMDMDQIIRAAKQYNVALEVNGSERLDPHQKYIRQAIDYGVKLVISSDTHAPEQFVNLDFGIGQARRGWAKPSDVLNTKTISAFLKAIKK